VNPFSPQADDALTAAERSTAPVLEIPDTKTATSEDVAATETWKPGQSEPLTTPAEVPVIPGYEISEFLGRGGMGFVVQARDQKLGRLVALKLPLPEKLRTPEDRERFLREAKAAARLRHPNICPIYEIGQAPAQPGGGEGQPYIALGFIKGVSLSQWAKERQGTAREAADILATLAGAVSYAHEHGVVHRDIKPANVMIDHDSGQPMLMDFGLAKDMTDEDAQLTHDGAILGTPAYMAPEQAAGDQGRIGPRSDIYGLGALLYSLLCGRAPFEGSFGEILKSVQTSEPVSPRKLHRGLHRDLETICLKAMAKDPAGRYATAAELAADLKRFAAGESILARPDGALKKGWRYARRRPLAVLGGLAAVAALAAAGVLVQRSSHQRAVVRQSQLVSSQLGQADWSPERYQAVLREIDVLRDLSPEDAGLARSQLQERYRDYVVELMSRPALPPDLVERIAGEITFVAGVDAKMGAELRTDLDRRLRTWSVLFNLAPPYADAASKIEPSRVRVENDQLVALPPPPDSPQSLVPLLVASEGNVELQAVFPAAALKNATRLGVAVGVDHSSKEGYEFVLALPRAAADSPRPPPTLEAALVAGNPVELQIVRGGVVMRKVETRIPQPPLYFSARRESSRLSVQLNQGKPLDFDDVFPLGLAAAGVFAIVAPAGSPIMRVTASRQVLPATPSKLERGDYLYSQGKIQEALEDYRSQETGAAADVVQEARCKQGLCLIRLNRPDEAEQILSQLAAEQGNRWPVVAACHLWLYLVQNKRQEEAEPIVASLANRFEFEQLATLLPVPVREALLKEYRSATVGKNLISFDAEKLSRLERNLEVERLVTGVESLSTQLALLRGYRALALRQQATHLAARMIQGPEFGQLATVDQIWTLEEYCWELRLQGRRQEALAVVNERLFEQGGSPRGAYLPLLVERARCQAALGKWPEAEEDIRRLLAAVPAGKLLYRHYSAAHLVLGFCREELGDPVGAQTAWKQGLYRVWQPDAAKYADPAQPPIPELPAENHHQFSGLEMVQFLLLASLTGEINDAEANRVFFWFTNRAGGGADIVTLQAVVSLIQKDIISTMFRQMCQNPRGKGVARSIGLQTVGLTEAFQYPMFLCVYEIAHQGAFEADLPPEQDEFLWSFAADAYAGFLSGKVTKTQFISLALTWKGTTGPLGWEGVAPSIEPALRGQAAYLMGRRFQRLARPIDAAKFFETAVKDSAPDSLARRLAQAELAKK
jgi:tRNA A-37 threonylcarbamoyl transferase component Bud32